MSSPNSFSKSGITITKEECIVGKRNKPAEDAINFGIFIIVSDPNPLYAYTQRYEYRVGCTIRLWTFPYIARTKRAIVIFRVTFENTLLSESDIFLGLYKDKSCIRL